MIDNSIFQLKGLRSLKLYFCLPEQTTFTYYIMFLRSFSVNRLFDKQRRWSSRESTTKKSDDAIMTDFAQCWLLSPLIR